MIFKKKQNSMTIITILLIFFLGFIFGHFKEREKPGAGRNRLTEEEATFLRERGHLVISPAGMTSDLVFSPIGSISQCGTKTKGLCIDQIYTGRMNFKKYEVLTGGVMGLEDCIMLKNHLEKHIDYANKII